MQAPTPTPTFEDPTAVIAWLKGERRTCRYQEGKGFDHQWRWGNSKLVMKRVEEIARQIINHPKTPISENWKQVFRLISEKQKKTWQEAIISLAHWRLQIPVNESQDPNMSAAIDLLQLCGFPYEPIFRSRNLPIKEGIQLLNGVTTEGPYTTLLDHWAQIQFKKICQDPYFVTLSQAALERLLQSDHLLCDEKVILSSVMKWIRAQSDSEKERTQLYQALAPLLRIDPEDIKKAAGKQGIVHGTYTRSAEMPEARKFLKYLKPKSATLGWAKYPATKCSCDFPFIDSRGVRTQKTVPVITWIFKVTSEPTFTLPNQTPSDLTSLADGFSLLSSYVEGLPFKIRPEDYKHERLVRTPDWTEIFTGLHDCRALWEGPYLRHVSPQQMKVLLLHSTYILQNWWERWKKHADTTRITDGFLLEALKSTHIGHRAMCARHNLLCEQVIARFNKGELTPSQALKAISETSKASVIEGLSQEQIQQLANAATAHKHVQVIDTWISLHTPTADLINPLLRALKIDASEKNKWALKWGINVIVVE